MQYFAILSLFASLAAASPVIVAKDPALLSSPLSVKVQVSSSTLLAIAVGGSGSKTSSAAVVKMSSTAVVKMSSTAGVKSPSIITSTPTKTVTYATSFPSTFSAPVQGVGKLSASNLPAMPAVIDSTLTGAIGTAYGLMSGTCNTNYRCSISVAGSLPNLLVDGNNFASTTTTLSAWCADGRCYGSGTPTVNATSPYTIMCNNAGPNNTQACSATIAGDVNAIFSNGKQVVAWGWLTPAGYCANGYCVASISAYGDPMY